MCIFSSVSLLKKNPILLKHDSNTELQVPLPLKKEKKTIRKKKTCLGEKPKTATAVIGKKTKPIKFLGTNKPSAYYYFGLK